jgi:hypothetical protein
VSIAASWRGEEEEPTRELARSVMEVTGLLMTVGRTLAMIESSSPQFFETDELKM